MTPTRTYTLTRGYLFDAQTKVEFRLRRTPQSSSWASFTIKISRITNTSLHSVYSSRVHPSGPQPEQRLMSSNAPTTAICLHPNSARLSKLRILQSLALKGMNRNPGAKERTKDPSERLLGGRRGLYARRGIFSIPHGSGTNFQVPTAFAVNTPGSPLSWRRPRSSISPVAGSKIAILLNAKMKVTTYNLERHRTRKWSTSTRSQSPRAILRRR